MANWSGLGEIISSSFQRSYLEGLRRRQEEEQFAQQMAQREKELDLKGIENILDLANKYRPIGQGDLQPVIGQGVPPFGLPPAGTINIPKDSYLAKYGLSGAFVPKEIPKDTQKIFEWGYVDTSTGKPIANYFDKPKEWETTQIRKGNEFVTYKHLKGADPTTGEIIGSSPIREEQNSALTNISQLLAEQTLAEKQQKEALNLEEARNTVNSLVGAHKQGYKKEVFGSGDQTITKEGFVLGQDKYGFNIYLNQDEFKKEGSKAESKFRIYSGLNSTINGIINLAKSKLKQDFSEDFNSLNYKDKVEYLKQIINNQKNIPSEDKDLLYEWAELYSRL